METQKPLVSFRSLFRRWLGIGIIDAKFAILQHMVEDQSKRIHELEGQLYEFKSALRSKASESFDKKADDKIPSSTQRYIPVARRRAAAEAASAGPSTHKAAVTANNARVMETL